MDLPCTLNSGAMNSRCLGLQLPGAQKSFELTLPFPPRSSDGSEFLVSGRDNMIHVYDTESLLLVCQLAGHASDVLYCQASGDRNYAISGDTDGVVILWDVDAGDPLLRLQAHSAPVISCDLSADCTRAYTLDSEGHAHIWYLDTQGVFDVMLQHTNLLTCCELMADGGKMVVGYADGSLRLWTLGLYVSLVWCHNQHTTPIECLKIHVGSGMVASACRDGRIVVSGLTNGQILADIKAHTGPVTCLAFSGSGQRLLSSCRDNTLIGWDLKEQWGGQMENDGDSVADHLPVTFKQLHLFRPNDYDGVEGISCCGIDPRGTLAIAACLTGRVMIWDMSDGHLINSIRVSDLQASSLNFAEEGRYVIVGSSDGYITVIEAAKGQVVRHLHGNSSKITGAYFEQGGLRGNELSDCRLISVCGRQAVTWQLNKSGGTILQSAGERLRGDHTIPVHLFCPPDLLLRPPMFCPPD
jgi:WD40 repeat protein